MVRISEDDDTPADTPPPENEKEASTDTSALEPQRKDVMRDQVDFEDILDRLSKGVSVSIERRR